MSDELVRFLKQEGTVDILCAIPSRGIGFNELLERVRISRGTLHSRLQRGLIGEQGDPEIPGLWGRHTGKRKDGKSLYVLTPEGRSLSSVCRKHEMPRLLTEIITKSNEFDQHKEQVIAAVAEHGLSNVHDAYTEDND